ncbi:MAG: O-antigen ligase family protein [Chlamydiales bacterium]|nr:O-antigen ligase family protein [Chlamydiales bacterium]
MSTQTLAAHSKFHERLIALGRAAILFAILVFPFQKKHKIFSSLASQITASFSFPEAFQQSIYFYLSDISLVVIGILFFCMRGRLFSGSAKYLVYLILISSISLVFSNSGNCTLHYIRLLHFFMIALLFSALENRLFFSDIKGLFTKIASIILILSLFESAVGISQYIMQSEIGLKFLGEGKALPAFHAPEGKLWIFDQFFNRAGEARAMIRSMGTFVHPNIFGGFMMFAIPMSYYLFTQSENRKKRTLIAAAIFFQILTLLLTFSRSALFAWMIASSAWLFFSFRMKKSERPKLSRPLIGAVLVSLLLAVFIVFPALKERGGVINYNETAKKSDHGRIFFQDIAFKMIREHPLVGVGYNQYVVHMQEYTPEPLERHQFYPVHNIYLLVASETGLFGALALLFFIGSIFFRALKSEMTPMLATLLSIFLGLLFIGCCDYYLLGSQPGRLLLFITAGLIAGATRLTDLKSSIKT